MNQPAVCGFQFCGSKVVAGSTWCPDHLRAAQRRPEAADNRCRHCGQSCAWRRLCESCRAPIDKLKSADGRNLADVVGEEFTVLTTEQEWYQALGDPDDGLSEGARRLIGDLVHMWPTEERRSGPKCKPSAMQIAQRMKSLFWPVLSGEPPTFDEPQWEARCADSGDGLVVDGVPAISRERNKVVALAERWVAKGDRDYRIVAMAA